MKKYILYLLILILPIYLGCGDSTVPVGTGAALSTVSPQPTGLEIYNSIRQGVFAASNITLFRSSPRAQSLPSGESPCTGGGTATQESSSSGSPSTGGSFSLGTTFSKCSVSLQIGAKTYTETLEGNAKIDASATSTGTVSGSSSWGITVSGDLGFSAVCDIKISGTSVTGSATGGSCTFTDSKNSAIKMDYTALN